MGQSPTATRAGGAPDLVITNAVVIDSTRHLQGRRRHPRRPHRGDRQGRQPGHHGRRHAGPGDRRVDRDPRRRRAHPDRRRHRHARPLHLAEPDSRRVPLRHHHADRRRHRSGDRHERDDLHARARGTSAGCTKRSQAFPLNFGFLGKGNASTRRAAARAGSRRRARPEAARGLGHDAGGDRSAASTVADEFDVQVAIHTDTLNEAGFVEDTIAAITGRTIHTYHTEGAGGGHAPDIIRLCGEPNVLPSSTNPTMPFTRNTLDEHLDMLMVCHHLSPKVPEDVAFADSRIRPGDDRRRGRAARSRRDQHDVVRLAGDGPDRRSDLPHLADGRQDEAAARRRCRATRRGDDNLRVRRYIAKYTINPAIAHGIATRGRLDRGRQAGRSRAVEAGVLRRQAGADHQGRLHRRRDDGRRQRVDSDAAAGHRAVDVRRASARRSTPAASTSSARRGIEAGALDGLSRAARGGARLPRASASATWCSTTRCRRSRSTPDTLRGARRRRAADLRAGRRAAARAAVFPVLRAGRCSVLQVFKSLPVVARCHRADALPARRRALRARHGHARLGGAAEGARPAALGRRHRVRHGAAARHGAARRRLLRPRRAARSSSRSSSAPSRCSSSSRARRRSGRCSRYHIGNSHQPVMMTDERDRLPRCAGHGAGARVPRASRSRADARPFTPVGRRSPAIGIRPMTRRCAARRCCISATACFRSAAFAHSDGLESATDAGARPTGGRSAARGWTASLRRERSRASDGPAVAPGLARVSPSATGTRCRRSTPRCMRCGRRRRRARRAARWGRGC